MTFSFSVITNIIFTVIILQKMDKPWNISCLNTTRAWDSPDCANVPRTIGFPDAWRKHDEHGPGVQGVEIPGPQFSIRNLHWIHWKSDYHMGIILFLIITTLNCHVIHDITTHSRDAHPFTNDFFGPGLDSIERSGSPSCQIPWKDSWRFHGFCFEIYWCFSKCCHVCRFLWNDLLWYLMHLICQQMTIVHTTSTSHGWSSFYQSTWPSYGHQTGICPMSFFLTNPMFLETQRQKKICMAGPYRMWSSKRL